MSGAILFFLGYVVGGLVGMFITSLIVATRAKEKRGQK